MTQGPALSFGFFQLACPRCGFSYPRFLPDDGKSDTGLACPSCGGTLVKAGKLTDSAASACGVTPRSG